MKPNQTLPCFSHQSLNHNINSYCNIDTRFRSCSTRAHPSCRSFLQILPNFQFLQIKFQLDPSLNHPRLTAHATLNSTHISTSFTHTMIPIFCTVKDTDHNTPKRDHLGLCHSHHSLQFPHHFLHIHPHLLISTI